MAEFKGLYDATFENRMRARGYTVTSLWQIPSPKGTSMHGLEGLMVNRKGRRAAVFVVQTFVGGGWEVLRAVADCNSVDITLDAAEATMETSVPG